MKLGLLVLAVLAAVVLVPSVSEGRVFSKCELKKLLEKRIAPKWTGVYKEHLLAVVICELNRMSSLNTSLVNVDGERGSATTTPDPMMEMTTLPTPWFDETAEEFPTDETPTDETPTDETPTDEMPTDEMPTDEMPTDEMPTDEMPTDEMPTDEAPTEKTPAKKTTMKETTKATPTTAATTATTATTAMTTSTKTTEAEVQAGKSRPKRMVEIYNDEELDWTPFELRMEELVTSLRSNCDEMEIMEAEYRVDSEDGDSNEEDKKEEQKPWSLGCYGVFQLSDGYYCDSGDRWSMNKCKKSCSAFTDDDITDDINCFIQIGCWKKIFQNRSNQCSTAKNYFDEC